MTVLINVFIIPFLFALIGSSLFIAAPLFILFKLRITDPLVLALAGVSFQVCYIVFCVLHILFSRYISRRRSILTVSVIYPFIILGFIFAQQLSFVIFLCGAMGVAMSMFWPTYETHISVNLDNYRMTKNLQRFNVGWSSGGVLGCLAGGVLFGIHERAVFYFDFVLSVLVIGLIFYHIKDNFMEKLCGYKAGAGREKPFLDSAARDHVTAKKFLICGWMGTFTAWFCVGILIWLFPKFATDAGAHPSSIGFLRAALGLLQAATFFLLGINHRWQYSFYSLVIPEFMLVSGFAILIISPSALWWILSFALIGAATGFIYSSSLFYSSRARTGRGEKTGIHEAILVSGALFGTFFGGIVSQV